MTIKEPTYDFTLISLGQPSFLLKLRNLRLRNFDKLPERRLGRLLNYIFYYIGCAAIFLFLQRERFFLIYEKNIKINTFRNLETSVKLYCAHPVNFYVPSVCRIYDLESCCFWLPLVILR